MNTALSTRAATVLSSRSASICATGIGKSYKLYDRPLDLLKEVLTRRARHSEKEVLRDISFEINSGEIVGIIGRNGAGKSTLLKIIAGTLTPTTGTVHVNGRVSAILELGTGFNPAYSGRDNVILSALMRGMSEAEVRRKLDSIIEFAGLADVIDEPFHTYSSGMQGRLAFAAAVSVEADVIIIDEALSTGDVRFAARSLRRIHEICQSGITALFVSHNTYQVLQLCTRAIWIHDGRIRMDGGPIEVVRAYEYEMHEEIARDQKRMAPRAPVEISTGKQLASEAIVESLSLSSSEFPIPTSAANAGEAAIPTKKSQHEKRFSTGQYRIIDVGFFDHDKKPTNVFRLGGQMRVRIVYECLMPDLPKYSCGVAVAFQRASDLEAIMYFNTNYPHTDDELRTYYDAPFRKYIGRRGVVEGVVDPIQIKAGDYQVSIGILPNQPGPHEFHELRYLHYRITILANGFDEPAVFYPMVTWTHGPLQPELEMLISPKS
jgi:ABC-type polysaccharide/polyol phosphate transport system ATPase subunit